MFFSCQGGFGNCSFLLGKPHSRDLGELTLVKTSTLCWLRQFPQDPGCRPWSRWGVPVGLIQVPRDHRGGKIMFSLPFLVNLDWDPFSVGHLLSGGEKPSTVASLVQVTFVSSACLFSLITKLDSPAVPGRARSSSRQSAPTPDPVWLLCRPSRTPASFRTQHRQRNAQLKSESSDEVVGGLTHGLQSRQETVSLGLSRYLCLLALCHCVWRVRVYFTLSSDAGTVKG